MAKEKEIEDHENKAVTIVPAAAQSPAPDLLRNPDTGELQPAAEVRTYLKAREAEQNKK